MRYYLGVSFCWMVFLASASFTLGVSYNSVQHSKSTLLNNDGFSQFLLYSEIGSIVCGAIAFLIFLKSNYVEMPKATSS